MSISVHNCKFVADISKLEMSMKFPCQISIQWKQSFYDNTAKTKFYQISNGVANINEQINLQVEIIYDEQHTQYIKKQTQMIISLIKPDKPQNFKIVGRVVINLADVLNNKQFSVKNSYQLAYCSMKALLQFKIQVIEQVQVIRSLGQIRKDSLNQFYVKNPRKTAIISQRKVPDSLKNLYFSQVQIKGSSSRVVDTINNGKTFHNFLQKNWDSRQKQLLQSVDELKRLNTHLKDELNSKQQQFFQRGQQNIQLKQITKQLQQSLTEATQKIKTLSKQNKKLQQQLFQTKSKVDFNIENIYNEEKQRRKKIDECEENLIRTKLQLDEQTATLAKMKEKQKKWLEKQQHYSYELDKLTQLNNKLTQQLKDKHEQQQKLKSTIIKLQGQISITKLEAFNEDEEKKNQIRGFIAQKQKQIESLSQDKEQLLKDLEAVPILQEQVERLNTQIQKLEQQKYASTLSIRQLEQALSTKQNQLTKVKQQLILSNSEIDTKKEKLQLHDELINQLKIELTIKNKRIEQLQAAHQTIQKQLKSQKQKNAQHKKQINILRQQLSKILQENNSLSKTFTQLQQELSSKQQLLEEMENQRVFLKDSKTKIIDNKTEFQNKFDDLYQKYLSMENAYKELDDTKNQLQSQLNQWSKYQLFKNFDTKVIKELVHVLQQNSTNKLQQNFLTHIRAIKANQTQLSEIQIKTHSRNLSIAFQKFKTTLLQSKLVYQDKMNLIASIKTCQEYVSDIKRFADSSFCLKK